MTRPARSLVFGLGILLVGVLVETTLILWLNGGHFTYTLDDAYIHLALAQHIHGGHYGINLGEPSAPSSSVLWPFLLAPFARAPLGVYVPFCISVISAIGTVVLLHRIVGRTFPPKPGQSRSGMRVVTLTLLILATNVLGLIFTGMEHPLQLLLTVAVFWGILVEADGGRVRWWLPAAIVAGPLVRYENLAVSAAAVTYLFIRGHRSLPAILIAAVILPLAAFSAYLMHLGLGPIPASVLMKAPAVESGGTVMAILENFRRSVRDSTGTLFAVAALGFLSFALLSTRDRAERALAGVIALAIAMHSLMRSHGWVHRYESYIWAPLILTALFVARDGISRAIEARPKVLVVALVVLWCGLLSGGVIARLATLPLAASNIYEQHYQMHRFVVDWYRGPVAVNDLGYVSYGNDNYVLDLTGLGSPEAAARVRHGDGGQWMAELARSHGVEFAMIYDHWFEAIPSSWRKVGELHLGRMEVTAAGERVSFYALDDASYDRVHRLVETFRNTLPAGVRFIFAG